MDTQAPYAILLVEDNPDDVELTLHAFRKCRLVNPVVVLRDGQEAIDYFTRQMKEQPSGPAGGGLILLDLKMPRVDGLSVLRFIRSEPSLKSYLVVMLTSSDQDTDLINSYTFGVNDYLLKPISEAKIRHLLEQLELRWQLLPPAS